MFDPRKRLPGNPGEDSCNCMCHFEEGAVHMTSCCCPTDFPSPKPPAISIAELVQDSFWNAYDHGFWDDALPLYYTDPAFVYRYLIPTKLDLIVSELSEALDNVRDGTLEDGVKMWYNEGGKPEGFASEMADTVIRVADLCGYLGIDLNEAIAAKQRYNKTRPKKHGKTI